MLDSKKDMYSKTHEEKKYKNYALLICIVLLICLFFTVTIIKFKY